ncbi:hypothetical protein GCM10011538_20670 [Ligilactobacillus murinus]
MKIVLIIIILPNKQVKRLGKLFVSLLKHLIKKAIQLLVSFLSD